MDSEQDKDFDRYFTVLTSAGARTRSILYLGAIIIATVILPWIQFDLHDWVNQRFNVISVARNCVNERRLPSFQLKNPRWGLDTCGKAYDYVNAYYKIPLTEHTIDKEGRPSDKDNPLDDLRQRYDESLKAVVANTTTTVPVVGTVIDNGSAWLIGDFGGIIFLVLLTLSLRNERRCLQHVAPLVTRPSLSKMIIDGNVFSRPTSERSKIGNFSLPVFWTFVFVPVLFSVVTLADLYNGDPIVRILLGVDGITTLYRFEIIGLIILFSAGVVAFRSALLLDDELENIKNLPLADTL